MAMDSRHRTGFGNNGQQPNKAESPPPLLHPEMATFYREQVNALHEALQDDTEATRLKLEMTATAARQ